MFNALNKKNEIWSLVNHSRSEIDQLKKMDFYCPICKNQVFIKNGTDRLPHFFHIKKTNCDLSKKGETEEPLGLKQAFVDWCKNDQLNYELEKYLPKLQQQPDLLIGKTVVEIQCSPLPLSKLLSRTKSYQINGYQTFWICGEKLTPNNFRLSQLTKNFCYYSRELGFHLWAADLKKEKLTLYYHIEEDQLNNCYFSIKIWNFRSCSLISTLFFSTKAKIYSKRKYNYRLILSNYYFYLNKQLGLRNERLRKIQSKLYSKRLHLSELPCWFYYPGIRLFCCQKSDLFFKLETLIFLESMSQKRMTFEKLTERLYFFIEQCDYMFHPFPNIRKEDLFTYCFEQLISILKKCKVIVQVTNKEWEINIFKNRYSQVEIKNWLHSMENSCLITAIPERM